MQLLIESARLLPFRTRQRLETIACLFCFILAQLLQHVHLHALLHGRRLMVPSQHLMGEVIRDNQSGHQRGRRLMVPSQHLELPLKLLDLGLSLGGVIAHRCALLRDGLPQLGHLMREIIIGNQRRSEAIRWSAAARPPDEGDHQRQSERSSVIRELLSEPIREVI